MNRLKQELFIFIAWWVKFFGVRNEMWYQEHLSRVKRKREQSHQVFDYASFGKSILNNAKNPGKSEFVSQTNSYHNRHIADPKIIAFYLPQFHQIPENDQWHGRGFTEWTNVTKAVPQFLGHHQPQLPIDVGFYDLASTGVMYRQIELAKQYGVYGFCFHYYWFSGGKRLLEKPIFNWLNDTNLNFPFCLCWANENWSKLWDGGNREVLMKQECKADDAEAFFNDILPFLRDKRYILIEGKPVLTIYRANLFQKNEMIKFNETLRKLAIKAGFPGIWLNMVGVDYFDGNTSDWGFDGLVEFPPMRITHLREYATDISPINPDYKGFVYSMKKSIDDGRIFENKISDVTVFRGCFPRWDNTARKAYSNASTYLQSPELFKKWLSGLIKWTQKNNSSEKQIIFINAWNEWAEGAHLEPDSRYGYAYLQAIKDALEHV